MYISLKRINKTCYICLNKQKCYKRWKKKKMQSVPARRSQETYCPPTLPHIRPRTNEILPLKASPTATPAKQIPPPGNLSVNKKNIFFFFRKRKRNLFFSQKKRVPFLPRYNLDIPLRFKKKKEAGLECRFCFSRYIPWDTKCMFYTTKTSSFDIGSSTLPTW